MYLYNCRLKILQKRWENAYLTVKMQEPLGPQGGPWSPANMCGLALLALHHYVLSAKLLENYSWAPRPCWIRYWVLLAWLPLVRNPGYATGMFRMRSRKYARPIGCGLLSVIRQEGILKAAKFASGW